MQVRHVDWMTEEGHKTVQKYLYNGEDVYGAWNRVATSAAKYLKKSGLPDDYTEKFKLDLEWVLSKGYLGLASPVFSELGVPNRGLPISCYSVSVPDSISGIFDTMAETAMLTKMQGGVGVYLGNIRPTNASISAGGTSSGVLPFSKLYDFTAKTVAQGALRRGSFAFYIPIDHPDVREILLSRDHTQGDHRRWIDSNIAVTIKDKWMREMLTGDIEKRDLFIDVILTRLKTGSPYIIFIDTVNNNNPEAYKQNNLGVVVSNLCFTGDTLVATSDGPVRIGELSGTSFRVYSARPSEKWSNEIKLAKAFKTGRQKVIKLKLSDDSTFRCTPDHLLALPDLGWVKAQDSLGKELVTYTKKNRLTVIDIEEGCVEDVYDLTVEDNHNFFIVTESYSSVLVHNCSEIVQYVDDEHSFSCCLSSLNLDKYDEWKDIKTPNLGVSVPYISTIFLDAVLSEFIDKAKKIPELKKAVKAAIKGRSLGLGTMGLASLYQKRNIPFWDKKAYKLNIEIHKFIKEEAVLASQFLAKEIGEPLWCNGTGMRNAHLLAIAPTRTNSIICNSVSQGIEPIDKNYFVAKQDTGAYVRKNPNLEILLEKYNKNDADTWDTISKDDGSVKSLHFLTKHEKNVFATAREIDQRVLLEQAADRQKYICQSQSLNLFIDTFANENYLVDLHIYAWKLGVKSLYYVRSRSKATMKTLNYVVTTDSCPWCVKLKQELKDRGVSFIEIPLNDAKRKGIWDSTTMTTVPQLFFGTERIGGYDDYMRYASGVKGYSLPLTVDGEINECVACEG